MFFDFTLRNYLIVFLLIIVFDCCEKGVTNVMLDLGIFVN